MGGKTLAWRHFGRGLAVDQGDGEEKPLAESIHSLLGQLSHQPGPTAPPNAGDLLIKANPVETPQNLTLSARKRKLQGFFGGS